MNTIKIVKRRVTFSCCRRGLRVRRREEFEVRTCAVADQV